jgi:prepilin-type N-terminal cleavage/methylation domain-containing protein
MTINPPTKPWDQTTEKRQTVSANSCTADGFTLVEIVVTVVVLAILSGLSISAFGCIVKQARARVAAATLTQIYNECNIKKAQNTDPVFTLTSLNGYAIDSDNQSCAGKSSTNLVAAVPSNPSEYPLLTINTQTGLQSFEFRGEKGNDIDYCINIICTPEVKHDPYLDPIHGDKCRKDGRTAMVTADAWTSGGQRLWTGCYDKNWKIIWDPCKDNYTGCWSSSFRTNYGWFPCVTDGKKYIMDNRAGPPVVAKACNGSEPISEETKPNVYCWPPREDCK